MLNNDLYEFEIKGNFWAGNLDFVNWFEFIFRPQHKGLFDKALNASGFEYVMNNLPILVGKPYLTKREFVILFCFMYNETNFQSMKEYGGSGWYTAHGYTDKSAGRGLIQLTSDGVYRTVLKELGYDYDSLTSEQLNQMFLDPKIYLPAVRIYLTNQYLAGNAWAKASQGDFYGFGMAISGQSSWYANLFQQRCNALLEALDRETLKNSDILAYKPIAKKIAIATAITGSIIGLYYLLTQK
jgi:hypothetical protein